MRPIVALNQKERIIKISPTERLERLKHRQELSEPGLFLGFPVYDDYMDDIECKKQKKVRIERV